MMKKQIVTFFLMLLPVVASAETVIIDGICYNLNDENNVAEVTRNPNKYVGEIVIPDTVSYEGVEFCVTAIKDGAFEECIALTSVTIPNSVTSIGYEAFKGCSDLASISIGDNVVLIDGYAFFGCSSLTSVTIPNSVRAICYRAFEGCSSLTSITIPEGVYVIDACVFKGCSSLSSVTLPNSISFIDDEAFRECSSLASITIPDNVYTIGEIAFLGCTSLASVTIGTNVTSIGLGAFARCTGLTSVVIPDGVERIGESAFAYCSNLTTVSIGSGVKFIMQKAFESCPNLKDFYCYSEYVPYTGVLVFRESYIEKATLHVQEPSDYDNREPWKNFEKIEALADITGLNGIQSDGIRVQAIGGLLTIEGAVEGTPVIVYDTTGRLLASAMTTKQAARIATPLRKGAVAIVKVGDRVEKVVMK